MDWLQRSALVLTAWVPVSAFLFRALGPRLGALVAVVGGEVFLPGFFPILRLATPGVPRGDVPEFWFEVDKYTCIGLGVLLGLLVSEGRALARARPHGLDLAMLAFVAYPLTGVAAGGPVVFWDALGGCLTRGLAWLPVYAAGRLYFGDAEGARRVAVAVVVVALANLPVCWWEEVFGPDYYVVGLLYGKPPIGHMVARLGGWRPEGFFAYGITLTNWMALGSVLAAWLWLNGSWRPRRGPSWWPPLVLALTTVWIRGLYSYGYLALGLAAAAVSRAWRVRWPVVAVVALVPLYVNLRYHGALDADRVANLDAVRRLGKDDSIGGRLRSEDAAVGVIYPDRMLLGTGRPYGHYQHVRPLIRTQAADGLWAHVVFEGGFLGLAVYFGALHLVPIAAALSWPPHRPDRWSACPAAWGLALFSALHMLDGLQNIMRLDPTVLIAGALVGGSVGRLRAAPGGNGAAARALARLAVLIGLLALPELVAALGGGRR